jgi:hypothetical protein
LIGVTKSEASLIWSSSFAGETGQFITDGVTPDPGIYTLEDFIVTSASAGGTIGSISRNPIYLAFSLLQLGIDAHHHRQRRADDPSAGIRLRIASAYRPTWSTRCRASASSPGYRMRWMTASRIRASASDVGS